MANAPAFIAHCQELLAPLGAVRARRMFGGHGLYIDALFVAIVDDNTLFLKADGQTCDAFENAGSRPFEYTMGDGRRGVMAYWQAPGEAVDSPALMQPWARLALGAALRQAAAKAARPARPASAKRRPPRASPGGA